MSAPFVMLPRQFRTMSHCALLLALLIPARVESMGCPSEQCNPARTGLIEGTLLPDDHALTARWHIPLASAGDCSSDGVNVVCTTRGDNFTALRVNAQGQPQWAVRLPGVSPGVFPHGTSPATPVMQGEPVLANWILGGEIFTSLDSGDGEPEWEQSVLDYEGFAMYNPGLTSNAYLMVRLGDGGLAAYDAVQGNCWASVMLGQLEPGSEEFYALTATVAIVENRGYIATSHTVRRGLPDRLYVADVLERAIGRIDVISYVSIHKIASQHGVVALKHTSGGAAVLVFGQSELDAPMSLLSIVDDGLHNATLGWQLALEPSALGVVEDPRAGFWVYNESSLSLVRIEQSTGTVVQSWPVQSLGVPASRGVVAIGSSSGNPVLIMSWQRRSQTKVVGLDLESGKVRWTHADASVGQFVIANDLVVYATATGITALG